MFVLAILSFLTSALALWPEPAVYTYGNTTLSLSDNVTFTIIQPYLKSNVGPLNGFLESNAARCNRHVHMELLDGMVNATKLLLKDGFVPWMLSRRDDFEPATLKNSLIIDEIVLTQRFPDPAHKHEVNEHYELEITKEAKVSIKAYSSLGVWRGLNTLTQLFYTHSKDGLSYTSLAPVSIEDAPAFHWRGLNLDVARNYLPISRIKRILDVMSWNKMNRLHMHMTDSQSWPLEVPSLPALAMKGAFECTMVYSADDFRDLQRYARVRGIEIVTEIDMPGHTASIYDAYPELITGYNVQTKAFPDATKAYSGIDVKDWSAYCAEPPCGQLKLNSTKVDEFLAKLLADVLPRVSKYTSYFHAGGDEFNKNVYHFQENLKTNDSMILKPLLAKLVLSVHDQIRKHGLTPIAWEEMLLEWDIPLAKDTLIQSWISPQSVKSVVDRGYSVIAGSSSATYLDCGKGQWLDFTSSAVPYQKSQAFVDYCSPFKNWKSIYHYDPLFNLTEVEIPFVKGFEVHAWSEQIDVMNIETALWPRAAAAAEIGWSGSVSSGARVPSQRKGLPNGNRSLEDAGARLSEWRERMVHRGIRAEPIHSMWCTQRPGQCSL